MARMNGLFSIVALAATLVVAPVPVAQAQHGSGEPGVANFLSAINTIRDEMNALNAEKNVSANDFHLANLQKLTNSGNAAVLAKALQKNAHEIHELREALGQNAIVMRVLVNASVPLDQVVALDVQRGGEFTIYYQPPA